MMDPIVLRSFITLLKKEIMRFMRVWSQTILSPVVSATLYILVFGISLSGVLKDQGGFQYLEFLIPGLIAMAALNNSLQNSASSVMISKFHNDLQDLKVIPLPPVFIALAFTLAGLARGFLCAAMVFLVGFIFTFYQTGEILTIQSPLAFVGFLFLGCLIFGSIGIWAGFTSSSFDQINAISQFLVLPLIYLGGVFYSLEMLHPTWQAVAQVNPLVYIINGIRWSVLGVSDVPVLMSLVVCLFFAGVGMAFAWFGVSRGNYFRF